MKSRVSRTTIAVAASLLLLAAATAHAEWNKGLESAGIHSKPFSEMELKSEMDTLSGIIYDRNIVETYLPVFSDDNQVIAIFELYSDVTELVRTSETKLQHFVGSLLLGYLLLFGILYLIVNYASKIISSQYRQLNKSNQLLEDCTCKRTKGKYFYFFTSYKINRSLN